MALSFIIYFVYLYFSPFLIKKISDFYGKFFKGSDLLILSIQFIDVRYFCLLSELDVELSFIDISI